MPSKSGSKTRADGSGLKRLGRIAEELGTVKREGLTEQLIQKLSALVLRGTMASGEQLPPERELAEMLGVSRSSLRQALKALQAMGVLEVRHGSGTYLSPDAREILSVPSRVLVPLRGFSQAELFEVRRALEAESAAAAAERANHEDLAKIRLELQGMQESRHDRHAYGKHDLGFHQAIAAASGNRFFIWFLAVANRLLYQAMLRRPKQRNLDRSVKEHEDILRAIESRDPDLARRTMLHHVSLHKYYLLDEEAPAEIRFLAYQSTSGPDDNGSGGH